MVCLVLVGIEPPRPLRINSIDNQRISGIVNYMSEQWKVVHEVFEHGDTHATRFVPTDLTPESVASMLNDCSYLRLPEFDDDESIVLRSRSREEVLAQRTADADRVAKELAETGESEIGWVTYRVCRKVHAPLLLAAGFDRKFLEGALA